MKKMFGTTVQKIRRANGLRLDDLAQLSGVSRAALSKIERGERNTSLPNALKIAEALKVPLLELMDEPPSQPFTVVRSTETKLLIDSETQSVRESLLALTRHCELIRYTLPPHAEMAPFPHHKPGTREAFVVVAGSVYVRAGEITVNLQTGDSASLPGDQERQLSNTGADVAIVLVTILYGL